MGLLWLLGLTKPAAFLYWTPPLFSFDNLVLTGYLTVQMNTNSSVLFQCNTSLIENTLRPLPPPPHPSFTPTDSLVSEILSLENKIMAIFNFSVKI